MHCAHAVLRRVRQRQKYPWRMSLPVGGLRQVMATDQQATQQTAAACEDESQTTCESGRRASRPTPGIAQGIDRPVTYSPEAPPEPIAELATELDRLAIDIHGGPASAGGVFFNRQRRPGRIGVPEALRPGGLRYPNIAARFVAGSIASRSADVS